MESSTTIQTNPYSKNGMSMGELGRHILLLAMLVATVTYAAAFNTPGGVWQDNAGGHLPGDPIIRSTQYVRYVVFYYCNATAFASSLMVFVLLLLIVFVRGKKNLKVIVIPLLPVMLVGLLSLVGAYAAGTFQGTFTAVYTSVLVVAVFSYVGIQRVLGLPAPPSLSVTEKSLREMLMQFAAFALTVTYVGGLSTPGGFRDIAEDGHRPGDAIINGARLTAFFVCNTTAFVASLLIVLVLLMGRIGERIAAFFGSTVMLLGLLGSYLAGSRREKAVFFASLIGAIVAYILFQVFLVTIFMEVIRRWARDNVPTLFQPTRATENPWKEEREERRHSKYIQFLAALALTITYQAGLDPPGGLWQENGDGHKAGDPILRTTNPRRYNAFFYCNSVAFVASLVCIILVQIKPLLKQRALEQAMILNLLSLVIAYGIGSCRDETTTVYAMGIGGATLVYVILHVVLLDQKDIHGWRQNEDDASARKWMGYELFLFALLVATITYQAGLTPPGGFLLKDDDSGHHAGDPVLLYNYPRRYRVFFFCNSTSFMVSIAIIILLVNPNIYKPALRTHALSVCTAVSFFSLLAAFVAGTSQHLKTSIYTLVLLAVVLLFALLLLLLFSWRSVIFPAKPSALAIADQTVYKYSSEENMPDANRIYLMTVGILVASVTYQAGLDPPGGSWQHSSDGHNPGDPVMRDNRRQRYHAFFYFNSTSFLTSIVLMLLLLVLAWLPQKHSKLVYRVMYTLIVLDFLGLLGAYAAGSGREWKASVHLVTVFISVLAYFSIHVAVSLLRWKGGGQQHTDDALVTDGN